MFAAHAKRSWSSRFNPFARGAEETPSGRSTALRGPFRPVLEALEDRMLPSGPSLVTDTTQYPASAAVRTITTWPDGRTDYGTGALVNQNTVLTSGAVVYSYADGGYAKSIVVLAGQNGSSIPYGVAYASQTGGVLNVETFSGFTQDEQYNVQNGGALLLTGDGNIGFISLDRDLGNLTGWSNVYEQPPTPLNVGRFGYPILQGYYDGIHMYYDSGTANASQGRYQGFAYWGWSPSNMTTYYGESGGPLGITLSNGQSSIVGVANWIDGNGNGYGDVITQTVFDALTTFMQQHPATGTEGTLVQTGAPPATVASGSGFGLTIAAQDGHGNVLQTFNGPITLSIQSGPAGAGLGGSYTVNAVNGVANLTNLVLSTPGAYTLLASSNGMTSVSTARITVSPPSPPAPPALDVPPLLAMLDSLLGGTETVNANGTETITDSLFGIPLIVATFDNSGHLVSVTLLGFNVTFLFG